MPADWDRVREEFPVLRNWTFLNSATIGQIPRRAVEAVARHFQHRDDLACIDLFTWFDEADEVRAKLARLIHCEASDIAFFPNASAALSLLCGGIDWRPGDRIVTLEHEFPNHFYFAAQLQHRGVEFVETPWERFYQALTPQTRLVTISEVNYSTGFRAPVEEIGRRLREQGVLFYLDGTQSLGALPFDIRTVQPDVYVADGYKWMLAPNGIGFGYVRPDVREWLQPAVIGWRSHTTWREPATLHHGVPQFRTEAERYEGGMLNFSGIFALGASVDLFLETGPETIGCRILDLAAKARAAMAKAGGVRPPDLPLGFDSPIVTARFEGRDARELAQSLESRRVLVAARQGNLRVSPHLYNDEEDIARLEEALLASL